VSGSRRVPARRAPGAQAEFPSDHDGELGDIKLDEDASPTEGRRFTRGLASLAARGRERANRQWRRILQEPN
jgi:hypothetical protein